MLSLPSPTAGEGSALARYGATRHPRKRGEKRKGRRKRDSLIGLLVGGGTRNRGFIRVVSLALHLLRKRQPMACDLQITIAKFRVRSFCQFLGALCQATA